VIGKPKRPSTARQDSAGDREKTLTTEDAENFGGHRGKNGKSNKIEK
jgi:hypothetical protein